MAVDMFKDFDPGFLEEMDRITNSLRSVNIESPIVGEISTLLAGGQKRSKSGSSVSEGHSGSLFVVEKIPNEERGKTSHTEVLDISSDANKEKFTRKVAKDYTKRLYPPTLFTATISGTLRNYPIEISENDLFDNLMPTGDIMELDCGHGNKKNPAYVTLLEENVVQKGKRGRPKKIKEKSVRKVPEGSSGDKMQSQLTFLFVSNKRRTDKKTKHGFKEWKYLLFRKGKIHLAGLEVDYIEENRKNIDTIINHLNKWLYPQLDPTNPADAEKMISLAKLKLNNVNYKFFLRIGSGQFIHHKSLENIFRIIKAEDEGNLLPGKCKCGEKFCDKCKIRKLINSMPDIVSDIKNKPLTAHPKICEVIPARGNKLSIKIATPFPQKPDKYMRVEMFSASEITADYDKRGIIPPGTWGMRINIKGGLIFDGAKGEDYIKSTYEFLLELFERYFDRVVRNVSTEDDYTVEDVYENNIASPATFNHLDSHADALLREYEMNKKISDIMSMFNTQELESMGSMLNSWVVRMRENISSQLRSAVV